MRLLGTGIGALCLGWTLVGAPGCAERAERTDFGIATRALQLDGGVDAGSRTDSGVISGTDSGMFSIPALDAATGDAGRSDAGTGASDGGAPPLDAGAPGDPVLDAAPADDAGSEVDPEDAAPPVPDTDSDSVPDATDNCPAVANATQVNLDGDGFGDACDLDLDGDGDSNTVDNCPNTTNPSQRDQDTDGVGDSCDIDVDGDGVADNSDNCPVVANTTQLDFDLDRQGDACDPEQDGDGLENTVDNCPFAANPEQADADDDGIGDVCDETPDVITPPEPVDPCATGATVPDLDADGVIDSCDPDADGDTIDNDEEVQAGADPLDASSFGRVFSNGGGTLPLGSDDRLVIRPDSMSPFGAVVARLSTREIDGVDSEVVEFTQSDATFSPAARLTLGFDSAVSTSGVAIAELDSNGELALLNACHVRAGAVTCDVTRLGTFLVVPLPAPDLPVEDGGTEPPLEPITDAGPAVVPLRDQDAGPVHPPEPAPPEEAEPEGEPEREPEAPLDATPPRSPTRPADSDSVAYSDDDDAFTSPWAAYPPPAFTEDDIPESWRDLLPGDGGTSFSVKVKPKCACDMVGASTRDHGWTWLLASPLLLMLWRRRAHTRPR
jgi:hypothetical protein